MPLSQLPITNWASFYNDIETLYQDGGSDIEVCKMLKIKKSKFDELMRTDGTFRELIDTGRMLRQAYWMEIGRKNLTNKAFNRNQWLDFMKNEFGWTEKSEIKTDNVQKTKAELELELPAVIQALIDRGVSIQLSDKDSDDVRH